MPNFSYSAINLSGKTIKGSILADSQQDAVAKIKARGITPTSVELATAMNAEIKLDFLNPKVKPKDLSVFCRQMVSILSAGVPLSDALDMLSEQTENKTLAGAIASCRQKISGGIPFSEAMKEHKCFPEIFATMIAAGESSGNMEMSFERMAEKFEKDTKLKALIKKSTMYPIILGLVTVLVVVIMMAFVVPRFQDILGQMGAEMPGITQVIINISDFVQTKYYILIAVVVVLVFGFKAIKANDVGNHIISGIMLKVPLLGKLQSRQACSNVTRTLATLLAAGLPMLDAIEIVANTMNNVLFKDAMMEVKKEVSVGTTLSEALTNTQMFPPMLCHMAKIGEETGDLVAMFDRTAAYYDEEVEASTEQVTAAMEPAVIVVMAGIVGTIVIALMLPMISMYGGMDSM